MDCIQFEALAQDLGRHRRLDGSVQEEALAHAESCARCARLLAEVERLDFALRSVAAEQKAEWAGAAAQGRLEAALVAEFRVAKTRVRRRSVRWQVAGVAAAAVMLLTMGWAWRHFAPSAGRAGLSLAGGDRAATAQLNSAASTGAQEAVLAVAENENDEQFIRLPYVNEGAAVENDAIVRAVLPRSALASLGFPVGDVSGAETVPVELMVSEDGTPEAIRLVAQDVGE